MEKVYVIYRPDYEGPMMFGAFSKKSRAESIAKKHGLYVLELPWLQERKGANIARLIDENRHVMSGYDPDPPPSGRGFGV